MIIHVAWKTYLLRQFDGSMNLRGRSVRGSVWFNATHGCYTLVSYEETHNLVLPDDDHVGVGGDDVNDDDHDHDDDGDDDDEV